MSHSLRTVVLGTRVTRESKARFSALAAQQKLTESTLLAVLVSKLVDAHENAEVTERAQHAFEERRANDRLTICLRPGDRARVAALAAQHHMKISTYLAMLVRTHVHGAAATPGAELEELRRLAASLGALGRQLRSLDVGSSTPGRPVSPDRQILLDVSHTVTHLRDAVTDLVSANARAWHA